MSTDDQGTSPAPGMSPPTPTDPATPAAPSASKWATVIGIIAVIFGSLGVVGGCFGALSVLIMSPMKDFMEDTAQNSGVPGMEANVAQLEAMEQYTPLTVTNSLIGMVVAALLIVAGAGLLKRRRWGATTAIVWSVIKFLYAVPVGWITYVVQSGSMKAMAEATEDDPNVPLSGFYEIMQTIGAFYAVIYVLWLWALPVFLLIWLTRPKVRADVRAWA